MNYIFKVCFPSLSTCQTNKKGFIIKKFLKILWLAFAAAALSGVIFYISLFLMWGRLMTMNTGIALAVIGGVGFFIFFTSKVINEKPSNRKLSIVEKGLRLIIFFLPFYILSFYFIPRYHEWNRTYLELYKYHGYPCENQTFTLKEDKVLFTRYDGLLPQSAYFITRHEIQEYDDRPKTDYYGSTNIPQGSQFKVIGYYLPIAQHSIRMQYFLVESLDNNKTKAWINEYSFNVNKCYPEKVPYYDDDKQFSADRGTYGEEKIDIRNLSFVP